MDTYKTVTIAVSGSPRDSTLISFRKEVSLLAAAYSRFRERRVPQRTSGGLLPPWPVGKYNTYVNGVLESSVTRHLTGAGPSDLYEKTWDQNNSDSSPQKGRRGSRVFRTGGPFASIKIYSSSLAGQGGGVFRKSDGNTIREYNGAFYNPVTFWDGPDASALWQSGGSPALNGNPLFEDTSALESRAFDIKPKIEKASILNALYEFKDVPGQLRQTAKFFSKSYAKEVGKGLAYSSTVMPKRVAEDWLNIQFGWKPFCKDINQMVDYLIFSKQYHDDITHGNDTWIKRRGNLLDVTLKTKLGGGLGFGCEPAGEDMNQLCNIKETGGQFHWGDYEVWSETTTSAWAEGAFKYYRPEFDEKLPYYGTLVAEVNRHLTASGLRLTPVHVYKAIPWSWLIDWFSNTGTLIERFGDEYIDGMVTKYLYLMHHRKQTIKSYHNLYFASGTKRVEFTRYIDVKQRKSGFSPYGFVLGGDLSATQWSILAALGLSKNVRF